MAAAVSTCDSPSALRPRKVRLWGGRVGGPGEVPHGGHRRGKLQASTPDCHSTSWSVLRSWLFRVQLMKRAQSKRTFTLHMLLHFTVHNSPLRKLKLKRCPVRFHSPFAE